MVNRRFFIYCSLACSRAEKRDPVLTGCLMEKATRVSRGKPSVIVCVWEGGGEEL